MKLTMTLKFHLLKMKMIKLLRIIFLKKLQKSILLIQIK